ncbi:hypothetical protein Leryth_002775 [Lithospermum erythrorhizon]|nr:hypothetical protein Leryth_002775 [Lithospermum erythrorhizon]
MMGSKWRKVKMALGLHVPGGTQHDKSELSSESSVNVGGGSILTNLSTGSSQYNMSTTPSKNSPESSKMICAICLNVLTPGSGHAIFTAECSHSFHFQCVISNVKHGNQICPICRAKWKEIPFPSSSDTSIGRVISNIASRPQYDSSTINVRMMTYPTAEPATFNDDEVVNLQPITEESISRHNSHPGRAIEIKAYPEIPAVAKASSHCNFTILIHVKAPKDDGNCRMQQPGLALASESSRTPVDLVTVLDVSGSMAGTKLALLKQAMGFVIQNLGPSDRLSVIAFSSVARRLFPLRRMTEIGKQEALQAVNSLTSNGGTNIAEGLRKGAKVMAERKCKNPVNSIILLSDGQDTYTVGNPGTNRRTANLSVLPTSLNRSSGSDFLVPVHTFGFGIDHDALTMHSISENSGGTFSFIESESVIQDAFAQCIGGILSVVVQDLRVGVECIHPSLMLSSIKAGSYRTSLTYYARVGFVEIGDIYAEEERDFLVTLDIPTTESSVDMSLLKIKCIYKDPISKELVTKDHSSDVKIQRPEMIGPQVTSVEVDRQINRIQAAEAMAEARDAADRGNLSTAVSILEMCRRRLEQTVSAQAGDRLCVALDAELKEMEARMANLRIYETTGRAYVLSGLSSHSLQRATARGDSLCGASLGCGYQTSGMIDMVNRSQTSSFSGPIPRPSLKQAHSFDARTQPM